MRLLLIHGSLHGVWCWNKTAARLELEGHKAVAFNLPGRGRSPAAAARVDLSCIVRHAANLLLPDLESRIQN